MIFGMHQIPNYGLSCVVKMQLHKNKWPFSTRGKRFLKRPVIPLWDWERISPYLLQTTSKGKTCHGLWKSTDQNSYKNDQRSRVSLCHLASNKASWENIFLSSCPHVSLIYACFVLCLHVFHRKFPNKNVSQFLVRKILNLDSFIWDYLHMLVLNDILIWFLHLSLSKITNTISLSLKCKKNNNNFKQKETDYIF